MNIYLEGTKPTLSLVVWLLVWYPLYFQGGQVSPSLFSVLCHLVKLCSDYWQLCSGERQEAGCWCWWVSPCHPSPSLHVWWWLGQREGIISSICVNVRFLSDISVSSVLMLNFNGLYKFIILFVASIVSNKNENTFQETAFFPHHQTHVRRMAEGWHLHRLTNWAGKDFKTYQMNLTPFYWL